MKNKLVFLEKIQDALCRYQVTKWILSKRNINCWYFSSPTSFVMKQDVKNKWLYPSDLWAIWTLENIKKDARKIFQQVYFGFTFKQYFTKSFNKWDKWEEIKNIQIILNNLGIYSWTITSIFDSKTIDAVYEFQIKNWILSMNNSNTLSKWWVGPATRNKLNWLVNGNEWLLVMKEMQVDSGSKTITPEWQFGEWKKEQKENVFQFYSCLLYTSPSPRD